MFLIFHIIKFMFISMYFPNTLKYMLSKIKFTANSEAYD